MRRTIRRMLAAGMGGPKPTPIVTNGSFSTDTTGWTAGNATLVSVASGQVGNCLRITNTGAATGRASQKISIPNGVYTIMLYCKFGTDAGYISTSTTEGAFDGSVGAIIGDNIWKLETFSITVTADFWINLWVNQPVAARTCLFDEVSITLNP